MKELASNQQLPLNRRANSFAAMIQLVLRFIRKNNRPFIANIYRPAPSQTDKLKASGQIVMWKSFRKVRGKI